MLGLEAEFPGMWPKIRQKWPILTSSAGLETGNLKRENNPVSSGATNLPLLLKAAHFAAHKHHGQRRKDADATPYINHPIEVADLLATIGKVTDVKTLCAALLHDTIEDTQTTAEELEREFGGEITSIVLELTDDKSLPKDERKLLQVRNAAKKSTSARLIKLGDKISNIRCLIDSPPR